MVRGGKGCRGIMTETKVKGGRGTMTKRDWRVGTLQQKTGVYCARHSDTRSPART